MVVKELEKLVIGTLWKRRIQRNICNDSLLDLYTCKAPLFSMYDWGEIGCLL